MNIDPRSNYKNRNDTVLVDTVFTTALPTGYTDIASGTYSSGYVAGSLGWNKTLTYSSNTCLDTTDFIAYIELTAHSKFSMVRKSDSVSGTVCEIDTSALTMKIYAAWNGTATVPAVDVSGTLTITPVLGRKYMVRLRKVWQAVNELSITDMETGAVSSIIGSVKSYQGGTQWGSFGMMFQTGNIKVKRFIYTSEQPRNCRVLIMGHSFIEGNSLYLGNNDYDARYAALIRDSVQGGVAISGKGGATTADLITRIATDLNLYNPEFVIIDCIANDSLYSTWLNNMGVIIGAIRAKKALPILVTGPPRADRQAFIDQCNSYIRSSGEMFIDSAKALTTNNDSVTWGSGMVMGDNVHPTIKGHIAIYERAKIDIPFLFTKAQKRREIAGEFFSQEIEIKKETISVNTVTPSVVYELSTKNDQLISLEAEFVGITSTLDTVRTVWVSTFKNVAGTLTQVGSSVNTVHNYSGIGNGTTEGIGSFSVSGTNILISFIGDVAKSIQVTGYIKVKTLMYI